MAELIPSTQGRIRIVTVANPAVGADWTTTMPVRVRWELIAVRGQYVADANVANRDPALRIDSGATIMYEAPVDRQINAGETRRLSWGAGVGVISSGNGLVYNGSIPVGLMLNNAMKILTVTNQIQIGDQWSGVVLVVREWIEPLA